MVREPVPLPDLSQFMPDPPAGTIGYAQPRGHGMPPPERVGVSGFGIASLSVCLATVAYTAFCAVKLSQSKDWETWGWILLGFFGNWVGCGMGFGLGLVGVCQTRKRRRLAAHAMGLNAAAAVLPFVVIWVISEFFA